MDKGYININENEIKDITSYLERTNSNTKEIGVDSLQNFSSFNKADLYSDGIYKINRQIDSIANSISNIKNIIETEIQSMSDAEELLAKKVEAIEIPKDFVSNDTVKSNSFDSIYLSKNDGRAINDGEDLTTTKEEFTSTVTYDNNLKNIKNSNVIETNDLNDINLNKVSLSDVSSDTVLKEENLQFDESLNKENLIDINNGFESQVQNIDTNTVIEKSNILNNFKDSNIDTVDLNMNISKTDSDDR